jgi:hypothetical protein
MRTLQVILSVLSTLLVAFTLICGFWIRNAGSAVTDIASSTNFHMGLAVATAVCVLATTIVTLVRK